VCCEHEREDREIKCIPATARCDRVARSRGRDGNGDKDGGRMMSGIEAKAKGRDRGRRSGPIVVDASHSLP
jgi:hypothetical protein